MPNSTDSQAFRIVYLGHELDPRTLESELHLPAELRLEAISASSVDQATQWAGAHRVDIVLIDESALAENQPDELARLQGSIPTGAILLAVDPGTSARTLSPWINAVQPRLMLKPIDRQRLASVLREEMDRLLAAGCGMNAPASVVWASLEHLARQATRDNLTGLLARGPMLERCGQEFARSERSGKPLACLMVDIDFFKRVNDVFGHELGDRMLRRVASLLGEGRRAYDLVGRIGGEEFLLLFPETTLDNVGAIGERIRSRLETYAWEEESLPPATISLGAAERVAGEFATLADMVRAADTALYEAKRHGRNQVWVMPKTAAAAEQPAPEPDRIEDERPALLVVDDVPSYLHALQNLLGRLYRVEATIDPHEALRRAEQRRYDLVLTDQNMPSMKGHELLARMKALQPGCARMIMTSHGELNAAISAINQGEVFRFVNKPWNNEELLLTIHQAIEHHRLADRLRRSDRDTIKALAETIELRDRTTRGHYRRVARRSLAMAQALGYPADKRELLEYAAWLHDIGKLGIPDSILNKTDPLSPQEERLVREHPQLGANLLASVERLAPVAPIIRHHHERFDGRGYPDGLVGRNIPEAARIIAITNYYDGLLTPHRGRKTLTADQALEQVRLGRGTLFDPDLVDLFEQVCLNPTTT